MSNTNKSNAYVTAQLSAGGIVPIKSKVDEGACESVVARSYGGEALGDRVVVRLGAERIGPAENLAMEFLGLDPKSETKPIGWQSRRAMGFASWALTEHPENAKYALVLVKRIKAAARKAKSKPGHAWDQFTEMAEELNRSVRHFLPIFWEEAARIYKDLANTTYAGRAIGKSLESERVHALNVDPNRRRDAVLEFTLSGCLSAKALSEYTRDLQNQFTPDEAYETLHDLMLRRTLGGMPPTAAMGKDLIKFAKAAKKDPDLEIKDFLKQVITSPSMSRAPLPFWKSVKKQVADLVKADETFGMWLLAHTDPQPSYYKDSPVWAWLDLLDEWNVLQLLSRDPKDLPKGVEIPGGRAGWVTRLASVESSPPPRIFDLIESTADAIRAEDGEIQLASGRRYGGSIDVDVLEMLLELGVNVSNLAEGRQLCFEGWLRSEVDHPRRNSQLEHVLSDERFRPQAMRQIAQLVNFRLGSSRYSYGRQVAPQRSFEEAAQGHEHVAELWWAFLDSHLTKLETGGMRDIEVSMNVLAGCCGEKTATQFPELVKRLKKIRLSDALQRTYVSGVIDEYGWKLLDDEADQNPLPASSSRRSYRRERAVDDCFPYLIVRRDQSVETFAGNQHKRYGEIVIGKTETLQTVLPVGDDLFALKYDQSKYESHFGWQSEKFDWKKQPQGYYGYAFDNVIEIDGGVFYGSRVLKPGDTSLPEKNGWFHDGERCWVLDALPESEITASRAAGHFNYHRLREIDPATGKKGRASVPAWFESHSAKGTILWRLSALRPASVGCEKTPMGQKDGMIGWCLYQSRDEFNVGVGIDGRSFKTPTRPVDGDHFLINAMIDRPEGKGHWAYTSDGDFIDTETGTRFARYGDSLSRYGAGQTALLSIPFWNYFTVRCPKSSKALRKTTAKQAKGLMEAAAIVHEAHKRKEDPKNPDPNRQAATLAASKWLPNAPPRLIEGIARIARIAAVETISLNKLIEKVQGGSAAEKAARAAQAKASKTAAKTVDEATLQTGFGELEYALEGTQIESIQVYRGREMEADHFAAVKQFFTDGKAVELPNGHAFHLWMLDDMASGAWKTFWNHALRGANLEIDGMSTGKDSPVPKRVLGPWLDALSHVTDSGLLDLKGTLVAYVAETPDDATKAKLQKAGKFPSNNRPVAFVSGKCRNVAYEVPGYQNSFVVILAYASSGGTKPPATYSIRSQIPLRQRWNSSSTHAFIEAVQKLETLPLISKEKLQEAAEKLNVAPIAVALGWMGNFRTARYGQEKLTKELREHYGWKLGEIKQAIAALDAEPLPLSVFANGCRRDPRDCLAKRTERAFDWMVDAWKLSTKQKVPIPPDVVAKLKNLRRGYRSVDVTKINDLLSEPKSSPYLKPRKSTFTYEQNRWSQNVLGVKHDPPDAKEEDVLFELLSQAVGLLNYELPFGAPARRSLPGWIEAVREFLDHQTTTLGIGTSVSEPYQGGVSVDKDATIAKFETLLGKGKTDKTGTHVIENEFVHVGLYPPAVCVRFRTSTVQSESDVERLMAAAAMTFAYEGDGSSQVGNLRFVIAMQSEAMGELIDWNRGDAIAEGSWDQDPRISVPDLVIEAAKRLKVEEDSATLYLQILSLHDPTDARLKTFNGWTAARLKKAAASLVDAEHLVTAKRSRAGRSVFLPGGWEALKLPNLPIETWKLPMFGYENTDPLRGGYADTIICPRTVSSQFRLAWSRVVSGDEPKYEER